MERMHPKITKRMIHRTTDMKISIQNGHLIKDFDKETAYRLIAEAGFEAIDWNLDHALTKKEFEDAEVYENLCIFEKSLPEILEHYAEELTIIRKNGLAFAQCHAPFPAYVPGRPESLEYAIGIYRNLIQFAHAIGCPKVVIHGISRTAADHTTTPADLEQRNRSLYESLIEVLQQTDVMVCLENLFETDPFDVRYAGHCSDPYEAVALIDALNAKAGKTCFGLCLDTGHLQLVHIPYDRYLPILGKRIVALHIHDNDAVRDKHMAPYTGTIRWDEFYTEMKKIGYDGDLNFETFRQVDKTVIDPELIPLFLSHIQKIGEFFRKKMTEQTK